MPTGLEPARITAEDFESPLLTARARHRNVNENMQG